MQLAMTHFDDSKNVDLQNVPEFFIMSPILSDKS